MKLFDLEENLNSPNQEIIRLCTSNTLTEGHLIKARLNNAGIDSFLANQNFTSLMPNYNGMLGAGVPIFIRKGNLEEARLLIRDIIQPEKAEIHCANCGSSNVKVGHGKRKSMYIFTVILSLLAFTPFGNISPTYLCEDCGHET